MAYCTHVQVAAVFRDLDFTVSGAILAQATVDEWIAEADAEIDARIGTRYAVPVSAAAALLVLRPISIALVADRVRAKLPHHDIPASSDDSDSSKRTPAAYTRKEAEAKLERICLGTLLLSGATLAASRDGVADFGTDEPYEPYFQRPGSGVPEPDQW